MADEADRREREPFFGRRRELAVLTGALEKRRSCLVWGPAGIGKSRLLEEALARALQPSVTIRQPRCLHDLLVELAAKTGAPPAEGAGQRELSSVRLKPLVLDELRRVPHCVILEDVRDADARMYRFLQQVYYLERNCLIVTAMHRDALGYLHKLLWDPQEEIALGPLPAADAARLFEEAARRSRLEQLDVDAFRRQVLRAAKGNPGQIVTMCRLAGRKEYQQGRHIKFVPLRIDALTAFAR